MTDASPQNHNYWQRLDDAFDRLDAGDYEAAEVFFLAALDSRERSPGRVFFTEKLGDGLRRLMRGKDADPADSMGRWDRRAERFKAHYLDAGEKVVREGVRLAELRPEDDAEANQPVLATALFLVSNSRLFSAEPASAVSILKGLFRTARRTGKPFPVTLVRHDLPLSEEDRLWLARCGAEILEAFVEHGNLEPGSEASVAWAEAILQILNTRYFGLTGRLEEERCWLEAVTADRLLRRAAASVELYRSYLTVNPEPGPRPDEARVRLLELLGNVDASHFAVPRYRAATGAVAPDMLAPESGQSVRCRRALELIAYRRPEPAGSLDEAPAWASMALEPDGSVAVVFWWDAEPRDIAFWRPGDDPDPLAEFLAPCGDRILAAESAVPAALAGTLKCGPASWCLGDWLAAFFEWRLASETDVPRLAMELASGEAGRWRDGWRTELGHPWLEPPRGRGIAGSEERKPGASAIDTGLAWLAVRGRVSTADPALRAGIGELARRGDPASRFLYDFLTMDGAAGAALDEAFEPWTLPLLWTRPDPLAGPGSRGMARVGNEAESAGLRPDLGRHDLAIVETGDAAAVLAAWGGGREKWRVVLDRFDRLEALSRVAGGAIGPVTIIPAHGTVHDLDGALALLEELTTTRREGHAGLLPIFHWIRLVETHNGDLLDFHQVRPRAGGTAPLYDLYADRIETLPREYPRLEGMNHLDSWGGQFSQRVRKAGLVAGSVESLGSDAAVLDSLWGVFEGSDASWVFLDSAAVHWALLRRDGDELSSLHALLHTRGRRHLSLLGGTSLFRRDLDDLLAGWLEVFGSPYYLTLTDTRPPMLRLVDRGVLPDARLSRAEACAGQVTWLDRRISADGPGTVLVPERGPLAEFWSAVRRGEIDAAGDGWSFLSPGESSLSPTGFLAVPALSCLADVTPASAAGDTRADWEHADESRREIVGRLRGHCALELAGYLAGPWTEVCLLDTRWWRLAGVAADEDANGATGRSGRLAVSEMPPESVGTFDLPGNLGGDLPLDSRMFDQAVSWSRERQPVDPPWRTTVAGHPSPFAEDAGRGTVLLTSDAPDPWPDLADSIAGAWEHGRLDRWILLVADAVPVGAETLVSESWVAGSSVWITGRRMSAPPPLMWALPEDFQDPELGRYLERYPPEIILSGELSDWLPGPDRPNQETALALRGLLDCGAPSILLRADRVAPSWIGYLRALTGAEVLGTPLSPAPEDNGSAAAPDEPVLDAGGRPYPAERARRLRRLLNGLRVILARGPDSDGREVEPAPPPMRQLLPLERLGRLAGLSPTDIAEGVRLLRWTARLAGNPLSMVEGEGDRPNASGQGHALLVADRLSGLESALESLDQDLAVLVPLWLGQGRPGTMVWVDLEQPPVRLDSHRLMQLDAYLGAVEGEHTGLVYRAPLGILSDSRRLVGCRRDPATVLADLRRHMQLFRSRIGDVMSSALETPDGFLVETGRVDLQESEQEFLALGAILGYWRWMGPTCPGALHAVDLLTLADSPTVREGDRAWRLWEEDLVGRLPAPPSLPVRHEGEEPVGGRSRLRSLLSLGAQQSDDLDPVVDKVTALASAGDPGSLLVLRGVLGSGRLEAVVRGLVAAGLERSAAPRLVVHCPDSAVAAQISREFVERGLRGPLDLRIAADSKPPGVGQPLDHPPVDHSNEVVFICELQRFDAETRYRIAQTGRGRRLVMTVDPAAAGEPWENLFLTTPRAEDVVELAGQRRQSRKLWNEVRSLLPPHLQQESGTRRRDRGSLVADYAANLDQGLARLVQEQEAGKIQDRLRVTAPMVADLQYLGSSLRDRGWLAVREEALEAMLLPGAREFLAAATDCLARAGALAPWFAPTVVGEGDETDQSPTDTPFVGPALVAEHLLGPESAVAWRAWLEDTEVGPGTTLLEFAEIIAPTAWANSFLAFGDARGRCIKLLEMWGRETLGDLLDQPQWEAWWYVVLGDCALPQPPNRRPLAVLSGADRRPGIRWPAACYLCLGPEPASRHYEHLARVDDDLLVLFQEHSPLPGDRPS